MYVLSCMSYGDPGKACNMAYIHVCTSNPLSLRTQVPTLFCTLSLLPNPALEKLGQTYAQGVSPASFAAVQRSTA
jgi:hypothetical protein